MKKFAKVALVLMCAVALVVCSILGTLAYLKSTSDVAQNTFTVGNVAITLDETDVDVYGVKDSEARVLANEYKLIPGHTYVKDPTVTVKAGSEASYIKLVVTISDIADVKDVFGKDATTNYFLPQYFVTGWDSATWVSTKVVKEADNKATYEFWYKDTVNTLNGEDLKLDALFDEIVVPSTISNENLAKVADMKIDIQAHAIQADGFADAAAAWAAYTPVANN